MQLIVALVLGLVFGLGIAVSGMINPAKVLNFFDVFGSWDPSLAFVMGGALIVTAIGYKVVLRRSRPLLADVFQVPTVTRIDARLITGAAIFGVGWGLAGFCPGGSLPALSLGRLEPFVFVGAMIVGIAMVRLLLRTTIKARSGPG